MSALTPTPVKNQRPVGKTLKGKKSSMSLAGTGARLLDWSVRQGRRVLLYSSLLMLLLGWLAHGQFVVPITDANALQAKENERLRKENSLAKTVEMTHAEFQAELKKDVLAYRAAKELLPNSVEVTNVLGDVQAAAVRNGITLTGFDALAKTDVRSPAADKLYERETPATVVGTYPKVVAFFRDLARMQRIVQVRDFALTSLRQRVSVSFKLIVYYAPPPSELPPLPADMARLLAEGDSASLPTTNSKQP